MKKSKFELVVPNEEDVEFFKKQYATLGEIHMKIEDMESLIPDARTKNYSIWKDKINFLISLYNTKASFKSFKKYE